MPQEISVSYQAIKSKVYRLIDALVVGEKTEAGGAGLDPALVGPDPPGRPAHRAEISDGGAGVLRICLGRDLRGSGFSGGLRTWVYAPSRPAAEGDGKNAQRSCRTHCRLACRFSLLHSLGLTSPETTKILQLQSCRLAGAARIFSTVCGVRVRLILGCYGFRADGVVSIPAFQNLFQEHT